MSKKPLLLVLGIRPDVIRASLIINELRKELRSDFIFAWSGQHYSDNMKDIFFRQLKVAPPDVELGIEAHSDHEFIGRWIEHLGGYLTEIEPSAVVFLGDTNTVLGTIACASQNIPIIHIEGCMRSYDWRMPEEKYRTIADHLSDVIYAYLDEYRDQGLLEGLDKRQIVVTGNPIVDVLNHYFISGLVRLPYDDRRTLFSSFGLSGLQPGTYGVMTCHRRENVDSELALRNILKLAESCRFPIVFPAGFRTQRSLLRFGLPVPKNLLLVDPIGYVELLELMTSASVVLTDSGTVVEEVAVLGIPSIQMRTTTERPQVYDCGGSVKFDPHMQYSPDEVRLIVTTAIQRMGQSWKHGLGDGLASQRIFKDILERVSAPEKLRGHNPIGTAKPHFRNAGFGIDNRGDFRR